MVQTRASYEALHVAALHIALASVHSRRGPQGDRHGLAGLLALIAHQVEELPEATWSALKALAVLAPVSLTALALVLDRRPGSSSTTWIP